MFPRKRKLNNSQISTGASIIVELSMAIPKPDEIAGSSLSQAGNPELSFSVILL